MNLARHADVLWRYRRVAVGGLILGIVLALLAGYKVNVRGGPLLESRSSETWTANSSILVTQSGFPEGRATLPTTRDPNSPSREEALFADPARLAGLADLYSRFLKSGEVLRRVPERPAASQIEASPFQSGSGGLLLPVIQLTANAGSREAARQLNLHVYEALAAILAERQVANSVAPATSVELRLLDPPAAVLASGRKHTASILVLLLCLIGAVALAHLLEGIRLHQQSKALASIEPWDPEPLEGGGDRPGRTEAPVTAGTAGSHGGTVNGRADP